MQITRFLVITALFPAISTAAAACEHCRAAAAATTVARAQAETSPTDLAVAAIRTAGHELRQSEAARKHLCEESKKLMTARAGMLRELQILDAQLLALKTHVHRHEYPLELGQQVVSDEDTAHEVAGQLLLRQETLTAAASRISEELEACLRSRFISVKPRFCWPSTEPRDCAPPTCLTRPHSPCKRCVQSPHLGPPNPCVASS